jgi:nitrite reductase/ring-hydroxylating ferredoxin subunit
LRVDFDNKGVLLYRKGESLYAIGSVCSHAGGPLEEGKITANCVECPWHGSVFNLQDGRIVHGPATQPQPAFDVRERDGEIQIKLRDDN